MFYKEKKILWVGILGMCMLTGCGNVDRSADKIVMQNSVDKVLQEQVDYAQNNMDETEEGTIEIDSSLQEEESSDDTSKETEKNGAYDEQPVDYDLITMSSDMVYATVYQFMVNPNAYEGCRVRIMGTYYTTYYEPTQKNYHYVVIQDALACCAQGMEFVWDDGTHIYPDEYPQDSAIIEVTGTFTTYREEGDDNLYCALMDAELKVLGDDVQ